jgi:hypothetical protein
MYPIGLGDAMRRSARFVSLAAASAVALIGWTMRADAQAYDNDQWRFGVTPYAWLSRLDGTVGIGPVSSSVNLSAADILEMLKFGIMGAGEAHKGPWMVAVDGIYASLGVGHTLAIRGDTGSLDFSLRETIIQPMGGYTIGDGTWSVDFLGGVRYWNLSATLDVDHTSRPSNSHSGSRQWVDATGGFRFRWIPYEKVRFMAAADGGGGGSRDTWQAYSSLGYDAWSKWTLGFAYRVLAVNYDRSDFLFDTRSKGIAVGATYRTK